MILKDVVYCRKPATLVELNEEIETTCPIITVDTLGNAARGVVPQTQKCLNDNGEHVALVVKHVSQPYLHMGINLVMKFLNRHFES